jgi:hypothetical protein
MLVFLLPPPEAVGVEMLAVSLKRSELDGRGASRVRDVPVKRKSLPTET